MKGGGCSGRFEMIDLIGDDLHATFAGHLGEHPDINVLLEVFSGHPSLHLARETFAAALIFVAGLALPDCEDFPSQGFKGDQMRCIAAPVGPDLFCQ